MILIDTKTRRLGALTRSATAADECLPPEAATAPPGERSCRSAAEWWLCSGLT